MTPELFAKVVADELWSLPGFDGITVEVDDTCSPPVWRVECETSPPPGRPSELWTLVVVKP